LYVFALICFPPIVTGLPCAARLAFRFFARASARNARRRPGVLIFALLSA
jgi:hypothetical protein